MNDGKDDFMLDDKIKWKFEILSKLITTSIDQQSKELESIKMEFSAYEKFLIRKRNEILAGIGFVISFWITLIQIQILPNFHIIFIIFLGTGGLIIFTIFDEIIGKKLKIYRVAYKLYLDIIYEELFPLQHLVIYRALEEKLDERQILEFTDLLAMTTNAQSYCLHAYSYKNMQSSKPELKNYKAFYELVKKNPPIIKELNLSSIQKRFEIFINDFEEISLNR